jgi:hypothetical protein
MLLSQFSAIKICIFLKNHDQIFAKIAVVGAKNAIFRQKNGENIFLKS